VIDDFHYPDIAQEAGIIAAEATLAASAPDIVVQNSPSEDQGLSWSPNGRWIAFHSHMQGSDDIWLRPADRPEPLTRLSALGRGAEVGWPRWSPDGRWIVFNGDTVVGGRTRSLLWMVGVDQDQGVVTAPPRAVPLGGLEDAVLHTEWLGSSDEIVFSGLGSGGVHTLYRVPRGGGRPSLVHRYTSTQRFDGFGVSSDGGWLVFPQPDSLGQLQLFKVLTAVGSAVEQLTSDPTEKTQPSVSPDGTRIAFTVWRYQARLFLISPR
jgi:Tol biopolymer transport system component